MATLRGVGLTIGLAWLCACGADTSSVSCEQYLGKLSQCEVGAELDVKVCAQRYGRVPSMCSTTFQSYVTCIAAQSCTTLADPNHGTPCQNEFVAVDIDCGQGQWRNSRLVGDVEQK